MRHIWPMEIPCVGASRQDALLRARDDLGAFAREKSLDGALNRLPQEVNRYRAQCEETPFADDARGLVEEQVSELNMADDDTGVLLDGEREALTKERCAHMLRADGDYVAEIGVPALYPVRRRVSYGPWPSCAAGS